MRGPDSCLRSFPDSRYLSLIHIFLGLPAAYALNRYRFKGKEFIKGLFLSPVLIPVIVLGFVMLRYVVNRFKLPALPSLLIGHTILSIPYVMRVVTSSLANLDVYKRQAMKRPTGERIWYWSLFPQIRRSQSPLRR